MSQLPVHVNAVEVLLAAFGAHAHEAAAVEAPPVEEETAASDDDDEEECEPTEEDAAVAAAAVARAREEHAATASELLTPLLGALGGMAVHSSFSNYMLAGEVWPRLEGLLRGGLDARGAPLSLALCGLAWLLHSAEDTERRASPPCAIFCGNCIVFARVRL